MPCLFLYLLPVQQVLTNTLIPSFEIKALTALVGRFSECLFVLRFYGPVNQMGSCRTWSVYLGLFLSTLNFLKFKQKVQTLIRHYILHCLPNPPNVPVQGYLYQQHSDVTATGVVNDKRVVNDNHVGNYLNSLHAA